jgi:hypothetical protein
MRIAGDARPNVPHVELAYLRRRRSLHAFLTKNAEFRVDPF